MTRLIAGDAGSLTLRTPDSRTRPTTGRTREALFSRLDARLDFTGLRVLDLYAGSAALGLEALSRGAEHLVAVENGRTAASIAERNARDVVRAMPERTVHVDVVSQRVEIWLTHAPRDHFDLVFIDPPYDLGNAALTRVLADLLPALAPAADVVVERSTRSGPLDWPDGYREVASRRYGETMLWFAEGRLEA